MKQDNLIICTDDKRYGKLGHLQKKYSIFNNNEFGNLVYKNKSNSYCYFIPFELVLNEYSTTKTWVTNKKPELDEYGEFWYNCANWVSSGIFKRVIIETCGITDQDYFDLFELKINNKLNRPRCPGCGNDMSFLNVIRGYGSGGRLWTDCEIHTCSASCKTSYIHSNTERYGLLGLRNPYTNAKTKLKWFLNQGNESDRCVFYITKSRDKFKYGITSNVDFRTHTYHSFECDSNDLKIVFEGTRLEVALLELQIKIELGIYDEYIEFKGLMQNFRYAFSKSLTKLYSNKIEI